MKHEIIETWTGPGKTDGVITPIKPVENAAHHEANKGYIEWWYFDAHLESGHVVIGFFQASELMTRRPGVELHVYMPSGEKLSATRFYAESEVNKSYDTCDVAIGQNRVTATYPADGGLPTYHISLAEGNLKADLTYHVQIPGWKPGEGKTIYGKKGYFAWVVPIPRAKVSGTITIDDTVIPAAGIGYHDHNWGTADMRRILTHWYWGRIYAEDFTLIYAYVRTNRRFRNISSQPLMLAYKNRIIRSTGMWDIIEGDQIFNKNANRSYPESLLIRMEDQFSLSLSVRGVIDSHDFLETLNPILKKTVNAVYGRPGYFRFNSDFTLDVIHDGKSFHRTGKTLHEMVALK